jgi:hypothetical protein
MWNDFYLEMKLFLNRNRLLVAMSNEVFLNEDIEVCALGNANYLTQPHPLETRVHPSASKTRLSSAWMSQLPSARVKENESNP